MYVSVCVLRPTMVAMHAYLKHRLPYPHVQQYVPGVAATFLPANVVLFTEMDGTRVHVRIDTLDDNMASKILSWSQIEGPGAVEAELLRSYVLYPGLTLTDAEEQSLVKDYIAHYYDVGYSRYQKGSTEEPYVYLHALGMLVTLDTAHSRTLVGKDGDQPPSLPANILNTFSSNAKYIRIHVKDTGQYVMLENYSEWAFVRIAAHAILRYVWTYNYKALSDLMPRGLLRAQHGAKPTINDQPIISSVYNSFNRTMVGPDKWYNNSTRDAFVVPADRTVYWYDDRGRRYKLVLTTTVPKKKKRKDEVVVETGNAEQGDDPNAIDATELDDDDDGNENESAMGRWVLADKDDPELRVSCGGAEIVEIVGTLSTAAFKSTYIEHERAERHKVRQRTVTSTAAELDEADMMQGDDPSVQHLAFSGDMLIMRDVTQHAELHDFERLLFRQAANALSSMEHTVPERYRSEFAQTRQQVLAENAVDSTLGDTIWIARVGYRVVDGSVVTKDSDTIRHAYDQLQRAVMRINGNSVKRRMRREAPNNSSSGSGGGSGGDGDGTPPLPTDPAAAAETAEQRRRQQLLKEQRDREKAEQDKKSNEKSFMLAMGSVGLGGLGYAMYLLSGGFGNSVAQAGTARMLPYAAYGGGGTSSGGGGGKMKSGMAKAVTKLRMDPTATTTVGKRTSILAWGDNAEP